jgi:hypothetical protein
MGTNFRDDITFLRSRRMLIIGGILLIVAIVVGLIIALGGRGEPEEAVIASPVASFTPTSSPSPRPPPRLNPTSMSFRQAIRFTSSSSSLATVIWKSFPICWRSTACPAPTIRSRRTPSC